MEEGGKMEEATEVEEMKEAGNGREMWERRSCHIQLFNSSPVVERRAAGRCAETFCSSAERIAPLICEMFFLGGGGGERAADRRAGGHKDRWTKKDGEKMEWGGGQTERQVVSVGVTSFED